MAKSVNIGDIVAIEHTDKDFQHYDYFLLLVSKPCYQVISHAMQSCLNCDLQMDSIRTDDVGSDFIPGDWVLEGQYLKRTVESNHLRFTEEGKGSIAIAHSHAVRKVGVEATMTSTRSSPDCDSASSDDDDVIFTELGVNIYELTEAEHDRIVDAVVVHRRV